VDGVASRSVPIGEVRRLGEFALLIGVRDAAAARRLARTLTASPDSGWLEVVGGLATVMVTLNPDGSDPDERLPKLMTGLRRLADDVTVAAAGEDDRGPLVEVPCVFDGPDLAEVAQRAGGSPADVIALLTARPLTVAVVGFSPGFAYLAGLPPALADIPRRARPRPVVPPGSVALANGHAAVYPTASPGGWQLIGRTGETFFTPATPPYARLAPGDRVHFRAGPEGAAVPPPPVEPAEPWAPPPMARLVFRVEVAGLRTVFQDGGRLGMAALGVPAAGPADPWSHQLANRLVGNPPSAGALEITGRGPTLTCLEAAHVAVVGAAPALRLQGQPVDRGQVVPVNPGQQLVVGPVHAGFRTYLAVAGGLVGPLVLGSGATDQLGALGPGPVVRGAVLWAGQPSPPLGDHLAAGVDRAVGEGEPITLRVVPGPHPERFAPGALAALAARPFTVDGQSNRVGLRLRPTAHAVPSRATVGPTVELDSQGTVTGAIQVPPDGDPVILLGDHATLGGYPVIAVVAVADQGLLGQCAPGAVVQLVAVDFDQARAARQARARSGRTAVVGHYPLVVE
jgi:KipI family sensor histidine kinase inhibitor